MALRYLVSKVLSFSLRLRALLKHSQSTSSRISSSIPLILFAEVVSTERLSAGPSEFTFEFVGGSAMWKIHLTATGRIDGGNGITIIPVSFNVRSSKMIRVNIELLTEGQGIILLVFISVTFDVKKDR